MADPVYSLYKGRGRGQVAASFRAREHRHVDRGLSEGVISASYGRWISDVTKRFDSADRDTVEEILVEAAAGGALIEDFEKIATAALRRLQPGERDRDEARAHADRGLTLSKTFGGVGRLNGDLDTEATALAETVIGALSTSHGPANLAMTTGRPPVQLALPGVGMGAAVHGAGPISDALAAAFACDATVTPTVGGGVDPDALEQMTSDWLRAHGLCGGSADTTGGCGSDGAHQFDTGGGCECGLRHGLTVDAHARLRATMLRWSVKVLSGRATRPSKQRDGDPNAHGGSSARLFFAGRPSSA